MIPAIVMPVQYTSDERKDERTYIRPRAKLVLGQIKTYCMADHHRYQRLERGIDMVRVRKRTFSAYIANSKIKRVTLRNDKKRA
jgi:hypothetical protein